MAKLIDWSPRQLADFSSLNTKSLLPSSSAIKIPGEYVNHFEQDNQSSRTETFDVVNLLAVITTVLCFLLAVLVVVPNYWLSWKLGFTGQIVFVGFLMSTMTLCMQTVIPSLFLKSEAKWGSSTLQNYDAILRNRFLLPHISAVWRAILIFLVILPLGLSIAYKRFLGGLSTRSVDASRFQNHTYGTAFPSLGDFASVGSTSMFMMIHPIAALMVAASDDQNYNSSLQFPAAYGYNVLLLSNSSAAMLDMPTPDFISEIQSQLRNEESWYINATVQAYVAHFNQSVTQLARGSNSSPYWNDTVIYNAKRPMEHRNRLNAKWWYYEDLSFGTFPLYPTNDRSATVFMGAFRPDGSLGDLIDTFDPYYDTADYSPFAENASGFSVGRQQCSARWKIDASGITLLSGSCQDASFSTRALSNPDSIPFAIDTLPVMTDTVGDFAITRTHSPWATPVMTVNAACMYWSLAVRRFVTNTTLAMEYGLLYSPIDESVESSASAMKTSWLLYLVLAVQPLITITAFCATISLRSSPINNNFGLISILAGVYRPSLDVLQHSGSSGKVQRPVTLRVIKAGSRIPGEAPYASKHVRFLLLEKQQSEGYRRVMT